MAFNGVYPKKKQGNNKCCTLYNPKKPNENNLHISLKGSSAFVVAVVGTAFESRMIFKSVFID